MLAQALQNALPDDSPIRRNARALQAEFASLGGVPVAADALEELAAALPPDTTPGLQYTSP